MVSKYEETFNKMEQNFYLKSILSALSVLPQYPN